MSDHTPIHWADSTCNPTEGCEGCELWNATRKSCYAGEQHVTFGAVRRGYSPTFEQITYWQGRMAAAAALADLQGRRRPGKPWLNGMPRLIFVSDMGDALCNSVPFQYLRMEIIENVVGPQGRRHYWLWLTKRPKRMAEFSAWLEAQGIPWPSNLWAGTSVTTADTTFRIDQLLYVGGDETIRFLSVEPQLEPLDLRPWLPSLDWIIQGGESGSLARRFDVAWAQELHGQCQEAETPYFLKQLGGHVIRAEDRIRLLERHGGDWNEWPEDVPKVRQMPMSPLGEPAAAPKAGGSTNVSTLIARIAPDYKPVFDALPANQQEALACYFLPHGSKKGALRPTRPNVITWYCPFACQRHFPTGHRYVINTYTACSNGCIYCYVPGYVESAPSVKKDFERLLDTDMEDLERFAVPPAPVHISNSTDPFQPLERKNRHTRYALEQILAHRGRFTTVTLLTKAPMVPVQDGYIDLFKQLTVSPVNPDDGKPFQGIPFQVQVSLAFWRDEACAAYDRNAPSISERREGILALTEAGIPVVLRIDPLFPRSPLPRSNKSMANFELAEAQSLEDLENLIMFAKDVGVSHIVYSAARIVRPGGNLDKTMKSMLDVYREIAAPEKPEFKGNSWRLPLPAIKQHVVGPFLEICERLGVKATFCMEDLVTTGRAEPVEVEARTAKATVEFTRPRAGSWAVEKLSPKAIGVSVSRRTDIPAHFGEWFRNRLAAGYAEYSALVPQQLYHRSLRPEDVTHFVFWTKNPNPFLPVLAEVLEIGYPVIWNVTITGLGGTPVEPHIPPAKAVVASVRQLAAMVGKSAILWRYDPIFLSDVYGQAFHIESFTRLAGELAGHVDRIAMSFVKVSKACDALGRYQDETGDHLEPVPLAAQVDLVGRLHDVGKAVGLDLTLCGGKKLQETTGCPSSGCNGFKWLSRVYPELHKARPMKPRQTKKDCSCVDSRDIGFFGTCPHGCRYCYANKSPEEVAENFRRHDPLASCLIPGSSSPATRAEGNIELPIISAVEGTNRARDQEDGDE